MSGGADFSLDRQIGARLREARLTQGLTQDEIAHILGVNRTTIARYESGIRSLSIPTLVQLTQVLQIPLATLIPSAVDSRQEPPGTPTAPAEQRAIRTLVRILEQYPELVATVLENVETLLRASDKSADGAPPTTVAP